MSDYVLVLDTETTGMDPETAEVIEVAFRVGLDDDAQSHLWQIRPLRGIPEEATKVHGITDVMTLEWPTFGEIAAKILPHLNRANVVVGYNPDYDLRMLASEFKRCGMKMEIPEVVICGKRLWDLHRPRPPRDLSAAYEQFVNPNGFEGAHGALKDARATAQVVRNQLDVFGLKDVAWRDLDPERKSWWGSSNHVLWTDGALICNFGKNKGKKFMQLDPGMLRFIRDKDFPRHVRDLAIQCAQPRRGRSDDEFEAALTTWAKEYK